MNRTSGIPQSQIATVTRIARKAWTLSGNDAVNARVIIEWDRSLERQIGKRWLDQGWAIVDRLLTKWTENPLSFFEPSEK